MLCIPLCRSSNTLASIHNARGDFEEAIRLDPTFNQVKLQLEEIKQTFDIVHHAIMKKVRIFSGIITISPLMSVSLHYPLRTSQNQNWKRSRPTPLCSKISTKVSPAIHSQHSVFLYLHTLYVHHYSSFSIQKRTPTKSCVGLLSNVHLGLPIHLRYSFVQIAATAVMLLPSMTWLHTLCQTERHSSFLHPD